MFLRIIFTYLFSVPPKLSISKLLQYQKGKTSHKLLFEFKHLQRQFWESIFGLGAILPVTSSNVTDEVIIQYIENQDLEDKDDNFNINT